MIFLKQFIISILIILGIFVIFKDNIVIPNDALRLRIIANSNDTYDQNVKLEVKQTVEDNMYELLKDTKSVEEARDIVNNNINNIDANVGDVLKSINYDKGYTINFGYNYFPEKEYKGITYKEGMYESLVVTLGAGKGDNWWCVMFPPFCLIEAHNTNTSNVQYKWLVKELLHKYFK